MWSFQPEKAGDLAPLGLGHWSLLIDQVRAHSCVMPTMQESPGSGRSLATLTPEQVHDVIELANRAPSVLNTQPWRWKTQILPDRTLFELRLDPERTLPVNDPMLRGAVVSCGAALLNARVAIRRLGFDAVVELVDSNDDPRLLAKITAVTGASPSPHEVDMFLAARERRTQRQPFHDRALSSGTRRRLAAAAAQEGAELVLTWDDKALPLLRLADEAAVRSPEHDEEVSEWVRTGLSTDGIPEYARGAKPSGEGPSPVRDFDPQGRFEPLPIKDYEAHPTVGLLVTATDKKRDWMRAGQALERLLLVATNEGVAASYRSEPIENAVYRWRLGSVAGGDVPQMMLRLGYGDWAPPTGRRSVEAVVDR